MRLLCSEETYPGFDGPFCGEQFDDEEQLTVCPHDDIEHNNNLGPVLEKDSKRYLHKHREDLIVEPPSVVKVHTHGDLASMLEEEIEKVTRDTNVPEPIKRVLQSSGVVTEHHGRTDTGGKPSASSKPPKKAARPTGGNSSSDSKPVQKVSRDRRMPGGVGKPGVRTMSSGTTASKPGVADGIESQGQQDSGGLPVPPRQQARGRARGTERVARRGFSFGETLGLDSTEAGVVREDVEPLVLKRRRPGIVALAGLTLLTTASKEMHYDTAAGDRTLYDDIKKLTEQIGKRLDAHVSSHGLG